MLFVSCRKLDQMWAELDASASARSGLDLDLDDFNTLDNVRLLH